MTETLALSNPNGVTSDGTSAPQIVMSVKKTVSSEFWSVRWKKRRLSGLAYPLRPKPVTANLTADPADSGGFC